MRRLFFKVAKASHKSKKHPLNIGLGGTEELWLRLLCLKKVGQLEVAKRASFWGVLMFGSVEQLGALGKKRRCAVSAFEA